MYAKEKLLEYGYEEVVIFDNPSYDDALIGVSEDNRAIYDYDLMIEWLVKTEGISEEEAIDWVNYNTLRALPYIGNSAPIVMYKLS